MKMKTLSLSIFTVLGAASLSVAASGFLPAPPAGQLGSLVVDPYGNSPLTAIVNLGSKHPKDVNVTVHKKTKDGVDISYPVGQVTMNTNDGVPIFGLYENYKNKVTLSYTLDGKKVKEDYTVFTSAVANHYIDSRNVAPRHDIVVKTVDPKFKDRLYMVNSHTYTVQGTDLLWAGHGKAKGIIQDAATTGSMAFENAPITYAIDTKGEIRWWLDQNAVYNAKDININERGYFMGFHDTGAGGYSFVKGQQYGEFNLLGKIDSHRLPRGYVDASHENKVMPNGHFLVRAAKANYINSVGDEVHTVRDQILEMDKDGNLADVWDLNVILDPYRDALLSSLDMGAVCMNVDLDAAGETAEMSIDAPYGDLPGVGAGRNWAHTNSIEYDASDDSIILSLRHQGVAKVTRDKKVKWIIAPSMGWNKDLAKKLLHPIDSKGKKQKCNESGVCDGGFEFVYTQHAAFLNDAKGTLTVFDNGDGRDMTQPAMPTMKYSRFVEYKINEKNMTIEQVWSYGKDRGYEWYSPITSNVEYRQDKNTMFGFGGSVNLFEPGERTVGKINEIDYKTKKVKVEIDVLSDKPNTPHYRALIVDPASQFGK